MNSTRGAVRWDGEGESGCQCGQVMPALPLAGLENTLVPERDREAMGDLQESPRGFSASQRGETIAECGEG